MSLLRLAYKLQPHQWLGFINLSAESWILFSFKFFSVGWTSGESKNIAWHVKRCLYGPSIFIDLIVRFGSVSTDGPGLGVRRPSVTRAVICIEPPKEHNDPPNLRWMFTGWRVLLGAYQPVRTFHRLSTRVGYSTWLGIRRPQPKELPT